MICIALSVFANAAAGGHTLACGRGDLCDENIAERESMCQPNNEKAAVRCCHDTEPSELNWQDNGCVGVWGTSPDCVFKATYQEATDHCAQYGARLCNEDEIKCAARSGCGMDHALIWTATTCGAEDMILTLHGSTGEEQVKVVVGSEEKTVTLGTTERDFAFTKPDTGRFSVSFLNDNGRRDVYLKASVATEVEFAQFAGWKCGSTQENVRCQIVRDGRLAWSGEYKYRILGSRKLILETPNMTCHKDQMIKKECTEARGCGFAECEEKCREDSSCTHFGSTRSGLCKTFRSCDEVDETSKVWHTFSVGSGGFEVDDAPTGFELAKHWTEGVASDCPNVQCTWSSGLEDCSAKCAGTKDCNVFNFCPEGGDCTTGTNRCCMRNCSTDMSGDIVLKPVDTWKGWDVYVKTAREESTEYKRTLGFCRGGVNWPGSGTLWKCLAQPGQPRTQLTNEECAEICAEEARCKAYDRKVGERSECCLFAGGNTGNGDGNRECFVKTAEGIVPQFLRGERGSNECPTGYGRITDPEECAEASAALEDPQPHDKARFYHQTHEANDSGFPSGCFYFHNHPASRLNTAKNGKGSGNAYLICKKLTPLSGTNDGSATNLEACIGECDSDAQCKPGLRCFQRTGFTPVPGCSGQGTKDWDYCYDPSGSIELSGGNDNKATGLEACTGECDSDAQCADGLQCFQRDNGETIPGCTGAATTPTGNCYDPNWQATSSHAQRRLSDGGNTKRRLLKLEKLLKLEELLAPIATLAPELRN